jgi:hypothetical protein
VFTQGLNEGLESRVTLLPSVEVPEVSTASVYSIRIKENLFARELNIYPAPTTSHPQKVLQDPEALS